MRRNKWRIYLYVGAIIVLIASSIIAINMFRGEKRISIKPYPLKPISSPPKPIDIGISVPPILYLGRPELGFKVILNGIKDVQGVLYLGKKVRYTHPYVLHEYIPLRRDLNISIPRTYRVYDYDTLWRTINGFMDRLGLNLKTYYADNTLSIWVMIYMYNWTIYGFKNNSVIDYIWDVMIRNKTHIGIVRLSISSLTGAILSFDIYNLYEFINKHPDVLENHELFNQATNVHQFNGLKEESGYIRKLLWLIGVDDEYYDGDIVEYNDTIPQYVTTYQQKLNDLNIYTCYIPRLLLCWYPTIYYTHGEIKGFGDRLFSADLSFLPLKFFRIIDSHGNYSVRGVVEKASMFIRRRYRLPIYIPMYYRGVEEAYYIVEPWVLKRVVVVKLFVQSSNIYDVRVVIDPDTMRILNYMVVSYRVTGRSS